MFRLLCSVFVSLAIAGCAGESDTPVSDENTPPQLADANATTAADAPDDDLTDPLNILAETFVKLSLAAGVHDKAFVDAYHGPADWATAAETQARLLDDVEADLKALLIDVARTNADRSSIRGAMLEKLVRAALARVQIVQGETFSFNDETRLLYDAVAPDYNIDQFHAALSEIDALLPGDGPLHERWDNFRNTLAIPEDKLQSVFDAAIAECRKRTLAHYELPESERFSLEFVTDKSWSGYNWYQGDYESLIQVNTDFPIIIDRAVDLGCHEGYPGHHTWNVMLERDLLNKKGWIEYSVYPLFSPLSVTAEGTANYGIELAFPGDEKIAFERDVLFPLAGLNPADAEKLDRLNKAGRKLDHARNHIARQYLDGKIDRDEAIRMTMAFRLMSRERAEQSVQFTEDYRSYVINYNLGRDIVRDYIERMAEQGHNRWASFNTLLTTPLAASDIKAAQ